MTKNKLREIWGEGSRNDHVVSRVGVGQMTMFDHEGEGVKISENMVMWFMDAPNKTLL